MSVKEITSFSDGKSTIVSNPCSQYLTISLSFETNFSNHEQIKVKQWLLDGLVAKAVAKCNRPAVKISSYINGNDVLVLTIIINSGCIDGDVLRPIMDSIWFSIQSELRSICLDPWQFERRQNQLITNRMLDTGVRDILLTKVLGDNRYKRSAFDRITTADFAVYVINVLSVGNCYISVYCSNQLNDDEINIVYDRVYDNLYRGDETDIGLTDFNLAKEQSILRKTGYMNDSANANKNVDYATTAWPTSAMINTGCQINGAIELSYCKTMYSMELHATALVAEVLMSEFTDCPDNPDWLVTTTYKFQYRYGMLLLWSQYILTDGKQLNQRFNQIKEDFRFCYRLKKYKSDDDKSSESRFSDSMINEAKKIAIEKIKDVFLQDEMYFCQEDNGWSTDEISLQFFNPRQAVIFTELIWKINANDLNLFFSKLESVSTRSLHLYTI